MHGMTTVPRPAKPTQHRFDLHHPPPLQTHIIPPHTPRSSSARRHVPLDPINSPYRIGLSTVMEHPSTRSQSSIPQHLLNPTTGSTSLRKQPCNAQGCPSTPRTAPNPHTQHRHPIVLSPSPPASTSTAMGSPSTVYMPEKPPVHATAMAPIPSQQHHPYLTGLRIFSAGEQIPSSPGPCIRLPLRMHHGRNQAAQSHTHTQHTGLNAAAAGEGVCRWCPCC